MKFLDNYKQRRATEKAAWQAEYDARVAEQIAAARIERRSAQAPFLKELQKFAGRIILVTNPPDLGVFDQRTVDEYHGPIAEAIVAAVPQAKEFHFDMFKKPSPNSGSGMSDSTHKIMKLVVDQGVAAQPASSDILGVHVGHEIFPNTIDHMSDLTFYEGENLDSRAYVLMASALAISGVNLEYANAKYGDTFIFEGATPEGQMQWAKIFQSPISGTGEHHVYPPGVE